MMSHQELLLGVIQTLHLHHVQLSNHEIFSPLARRKCSYHYYSYVSLTQTPTSSYFKTWTQTPKNALEHNSDATFLFII
jgi:hypothetical protein